jgi:hypothetical protein
MSDTLRDQGDERMSQIDRVMELERALDENRVLHTLCDSYLAAEANLAAAVANERERCAKVCEDLETKFKHRDYDLSEGARQCAHAIRSI